MALDIRIRSGKAAPPNAELQIALNNDGYYWFLHPFFERLRDQCGKYVDLYGDALFTSDDYPRLRRLLDEARAMAEAQPATWNVPIRTQVRPVRKELYAAVRRDQLLRLIETIRNMVETAHLLDGQLECLGD
jgi:hypothetical protein